MRSTGSGPMGALLMLAPLVAVPILAVVGIPQFAPGNLIDINGSKSAATSRDSRDYAEPRYGDAARHDADDLFAPLEESDSESGLEGFDDPLAGRRPRSSGRNARRDVEDEFADEPVRSRGRRAPAFDENQDEFTEISADELNGDEMEEVAPRGRNRPRLRSKSTPDDFETNADNADFSNDFGDVPSPKTKPRGERYADASSNADFGGKLKARTSSDRRPQFEQQEPEENASEAAEGANPFEPPPVEEVARQAPNRKKSLPPTRPRDRLDAPIFEPQESAPEGEDAASFAPPPAAKASNTGRRSPQAVVPPSPPETVAEQEPENTSFAQETSDEEQVPGVEELTWKDATKRLRALGVGKSKQYFTYLEDSNSFLFSCTATHGKNAKKVQRFEAEAELPLLAVSQVLQQLEEWQSASPGRTVARGPE